MAESELIMDENNRRLKDEPRQQNQQVSILKRQLQTKLQERGLAVLKLGESAYRKIRSEELQNEEWTELVETIFRKDCDIYQLQNQLADLTKDESVGVRICIHCHATINAGDKFCGSCGKVVEEQSPIEEKVACHKCEALVPVSAEYCGCCGTRMLERGE